MTSFIQAQKYTLEEHADQVPAVGKRNILGMNCQSIHLTILLCNLNQYVVFCRM